MSAQGRPLLCPVPRAPSPPQNAPWPRGAAVRPPRGAPSCRGDGLAEGLTCSAPVFLRGVPRALSHQLVVRIARQRGEAGLPLRELALPLLVHPTVIRHLPLLPQLLVKHPVQLPCAR
eukprot:scaffold24472_cov63-Phaeocystis_antarctica.AAC.3